MVLVVSITVLIAAVVGGFVTEAITGGDSAPQEPPTAGVTFSYDYAESSDKVKITVESSGSAERLYVARRSGFNDTDIIRATGGWLNTTAGRGNLGSIVNGTRVVNEDVGSGDTVILGNVTAEDDLTLTADKGEGTNAVVLEYWERDDWTYEP